MATIALNGLTPEAVWTGLRLDWLITEEGWGVGRRAWGGRGEDAPEKAAYPEPANQSFNHQLNRQWFKQVSNRRHQLDNSLPTPPLPVPLVLIAETHPPTFLASFLAAALAGWNIALANPRWGTQEWQSLSQLISPNVVWGDNIPIQPTNLAPTNLAPTNLAPTNLAPTNLAPTNLAKKHPPSSSRQAAAAPAILIPTGGSSGQVKLAHHTWASLMISVTGFRQHFAPNGAPIHTYCVLPVHHVSGLMQILRAWTSNAQVTLIPFKTLETTLFPPSPTPPLPTPPLPTPPLSPFISLVPTQLHRLLQASKGPWLSQFQAVLLGGAPPWPTLLAHAAQHHIPLYLSYGMTETAAMVTAFKLGPLPRQGRPLSSGQALPHATIEIVQDGRRLPPGEMGQVVVHSSAIAQGYYTPSDRPSPENSPPDNFSPGTFYTDDLGYLSTAGHLYITGRASGKIISGGENIFPAEVEAALRSTGLVKDICIIGQPHELWGEVVTAIYVPRHENVSPAQLKQALLAPDPHNTPILSSYKHPRQWISQETLPRNEQGKLNRAKLLDLIQTSVKSTSQPNSSAVSG